MNAAMGSWAGNLGVPSFTGQAGEQGTDEADQRAKNSGRQSLYSDWCRLVGGGVAREWPRDELREPEEEATDLNRAQ